MASPYVYSSVGGSAGADLTTRSSWSTSGQIWYVYATTGTDAGGSRGTDRVRPLATLAQAYTNASAGDTITFLAGHAESLSGSQTLGKAGLHLYSEGSGVSAARFTCTGTVAMFDVTADGVMLEDIYFPTSTAVPTARVRTANVNTYLKGCTFECGASDTASALKFVTGAAQGRVRSCTFLSTATAVASQPAIGIEVANAMSDLHVENTVFDGGSFGWSDYSLKGTAAITRLHAYDLSLLNGSDVITATGSTYRVHVKLATGSSRLVLTA